MDDRLVELEERFAHQELAVDTLTRTVLEQGRMLVALGDEIKTLRVQLREAASANLATEAEETLPPHY